MQSASALSDAHSQVFFGNDPHVDSCAVHLLWNFPLWTATCSVVLTECAIENANGVFFLLRLSLSLVDHMDVDAC